MLREGGGRIPHGHCPPSRDKGQEALEMSTRSVLRPGQAGSGESADPHRDHWECLCCQVPPCRQRGWDSRQASPEPLAGPAIPLRAAGSPQVTVWRLLQMHTQPDVGEAEALITALHLPAGSDHFFLHLITGAPGRQNIRQAQHSLFDLIKPC